MVTGQRQQREQRIVLPYSVEKGWARSRRWRRTAGSESGGRRAQLGRASECVSRGEVESRRPRPRPPRIVQLKHMHSTRRRRPGRQ